MWKDGTISLHSYQPDSDFKNFAATDEEELSDLLKSLSYKWKDAIVSFEV